MMSIGDDDDILIMKKKRRSNGGEGEGGRKVVRMRCIMWVIFIEVLLILEHASKVDYY